MTPRNTGNTSLPLAIQIARRLAGRAIRLLVFRGLRGLRCAYRCGLGRAPVARGVDGGRRTRRCARHEGATLEQVRDPLERVAAHGDGPRVVSRDRLDALLVLPDQRPDERQLVSAERPPGVEPLRAARRDRARAGSGELSRLRGIHELHRGAVEARRPTAAAAPVDDLDPGILAAAAHAYAAVLRGLCVLGVLGGISLRGAGWVAGSQDVLVHASTGTRGGRHV